MEKGSDTRLGFVIALLTGAIFFFDIATPLSLAVWTLYLIPLFLTIYVRQRSAPVYVACTVIVLTVTGIFIAYPDETVINALISRVFFSGVIAVIAYFIWNYRKNVAALDRSREEQRQAHALLTTHIANSPLAIISFDAQFRITLWSRDATRIFGWTPEEVTGKAIGEFPWIYEEDVERVTKISADMMSGKSSRNMHANRNYRKDGAVIECEWYNSALRDEKGNLVSIFSQVLDVTRRNRDEAEIERKNQSLGAANEELRAIHEELQQNIDELARSELKLRVNEARYRSLFTSMSEAFAVHEMIFNPEGRPCDYRWLLVNPAFEKETGLVASEIIGKTVREKMPGIEASWIETYGKVVQTGAPVRFEDRNAATGKYYEVFAFRPEENRFAVIFRDITDRKRTESNQSLMRDVLRVLNQGGELHALVRETLRIIRDTTGFDAIGLRMQDGDDFPYYEQIGFPDEFVREENLICARLRNGEIARDADGRAILECTCGLILSGLTDPSMSCFTGTGSFWTNKSSDLLTLPPEADPRTTPRNRCIHDGYQSIALIPVRSGGKNIGLLQLNDRQELRFTPEFIGFFESLADNLGLAIMRRQAEEELESRNKSLHAANEELSAIHEELQQNMDELAKNDRTLRETSQYLENLITYANAPIIVWDPAFCITRFNHAFEYLTGRTADETIGKPLDILFPGDQREELMAMIRRTLTGERWEAVEIPIQHVGGEVKTVLWNSATLYEPDGKTVSSVIAQGQDITSRKRAEETLRETSQYLENLITYANAPIIVWNTDLRITRFNHASEMLTGRSAESVSGKRLDILFPPGRKKELMGLIRRTLTGEHWENAEIPVQDALGEVHTVLWNSATLYEPDGKTVSSVIAQGQDITFRKQVEHELRIRNESLSTLNEELTATHEELQQNVDELAKREADLRQHEHELNDALAEKDVLLSEIHHRVKNNLAAFISLLSLEGTYEETPEGQNLKKDLQNRARSMALIHETLYRTRSYASVDMGVYLTTLMDQIAGSYKSAKPIKIAVDADGVVIDITRATPCGLIINELVTNSFKYAFPASFECKEVRHEPCAIRVSLQKKDGNYILGVSDNGIGFPTGFDVRTAQSLGLKLVSFLARHQLRAKIDVNSDNGSEFIFTFKDKL